jgi:hypothetical protein
MAAAAPASARAVLLGHQSQQQVLAADVVVAHGDRFGHRQLERVGQRSAELVRRVIAGRRLGQVVEHPSRIDLRGGQHLERHVVALFDDSAQQVFRSHLRRPVLARPLDRDLDRDAGPLREVRQLCRRVVTPQLADRGRADRRHPLHRGLQRPLADRRHRHPGLPDRLRQLVGQIHVDLGHHDVSPSRSLR